MLFECNEWLYSNHSYYYYITVVQKLSHQFCGKLLEKIDVGKKGGNAVPPKMKLKETKAYLMEQNFKSKEDSAYSLTAFHIFESQV